MTDAGYFPYSTEDPNIYTPHSLYQASQLPASSDHQFEPETKPRIHNYYGGVTANFTQDNSALLAYTLADQNANNITSSSQQMVQSAQLSIGQGPSSMNQGWGSTMHQTMFDQMTAAQVFNSRSSGLPQPTQGTSPTIARAIAVAQNQKRPRSEKKPIPSEQKDNKYFERRKRNNQAAKKSRDARKAREDEIAIRASFLEKENAILRAQTATLREEANSLKQLLLQKTRHRQ